MTDIWDERKKGLLNRIIEQRNGSYVLCLASSRFGQPAVRLPAWK